MGTLLISFLQLMCHADLFFVVCMNGITRTWGSANDLESPSPFSSLWRHYDVHINVALFEVPGGAASSQPDLSTVHNVSCICFFPTEAKTYREDRKMQKSQTKFYTFSHISFIKPFFIPLLSYLVENSATKAGKITSLILLSSILPPSVSPR